MLKGDKSLKYSLMLHGVALVGLALATFLGGCKERVRPDHVFEMVDLSEVSEMAQQVARALPQVDTRLEMPEFEVLKPPAQPEVTPQPQPPAPEVKALPAQPKPPAEPVKRVAYDPTKYAKPETTPAKPVVQRTQVKAPSFDKAKLRQSLQSVELSLASSSQRSSEDANKAQAYANEIQKLLKRAWNKPDMEGWVRLLIIVSADGTLTARVYESSKNSVFNETALEAVRRVGKAATAPPGGYLEFYVPFQINTE